MIRVWLVSAGALQMPHPRTVETGEVEEERRLFYVAVTRAKHGVGNEEAEKRFNAGLAASRPA